MAESKTIRVLVVDDEKLARQRIIDLLAKENDVEVAGTAANGNEAVAEIHRLSPDLIFLDVQMPGLTGLQVIDAIGAADMPATIFVTAFDQFALEAFDRAAVDYLVKPFDDERFAQAFRRARKNIELEEVERMTRRLLALLSEERAETSRTSTSPASAKPEYLERISVETRGQLRVLPVDKVDYITASGPYAEIHVGDKTWAVRERMQTLEERLDPARFFRVHRSAIVKLDRIDVLLHSSGGDYAVRLKNGVELSVSRARRDELAQRLGIS